ncbi:hypothetical protein, partial [Pontibacillus sp. HN14]
GKKNNLALVELYNNKKGVDPFEYLVEEKEEVNNNVGKFNPFGNFKQEKTQTGKVLPFKK